MDSAKQFKRFIGESESQSRRFIGESESQSRRFIEESELKKYAQPLYSFFSKRIMQKTATSTSIKQQINRVAVCS